MQRTVGLVQSDDVVRREYADFLRASGYHVEAYRERATAIEGFVRNTPDLALLDVTLGPDRDGGLRLCSEIRTKWPLLPVAFLTACATEQDQILSLRVGADDHISTSASFRLVALRLEAFLKRHDRANGPLGASPSTIAIGQLRIDVRWSEVYWGERSIPLSLTQYRMVKALAVAAPGPKTADELMQAAETHVARNTVSVHIRAIRLRFREFDPRFDNIRTERGHGYRWVP